MRLTKCRLITLGIGLLAAALTAAGLAVPSGTAKAGTINFLVTLYGWPDNSPPGNAIAYPADQGYPAIHNVASGVGTYSDPITYATDKNELPVGTIVYYPYLHRYFIMEDDCVECDQDWTGNGPDGGPGLYHIDLWINGQNGNSTDVINCEDALTQNSAPVIIDPPSNEPVDTTPLFDSSTNTCYDPSSFTGGGGGSAATITGNHSGLCLSLTGDTTAPKTAAAIDTCDGDSAQKWTVNSDGTIVNGSGLCLSVSGGSTAPRSTANVYTCNGSASERWTVHSDGTITGNHSGLCLSVSGGSTKPGSTADIYTCNGSTSEYWTVHAG
ncbi:MAG: ricin-type beta-trefoil lectin domain protein [Streptosporangiaceae bacterium]|nr:ricin-type beta-trefoil lectin domain protein [Streptosporangiaceae bacterium]MBV9858427.1 ricin-type beta-trefoil lectin domain protein [Streptosporangiaceae bacterium]